MNVNADERGFSYIDVMIGIMILFVGIMALTAAVTAAVIRSRELEQQLRAKQHAASTLESIFAARDSDANTLGWNRIGNVGSASVPLGIFITNLQPIRPTAGADGVVGTADDAGAPTPGFQRQITITDINDPQRPTPPNPIMMRRVEVTITYQAGSALRRETVATVITNYL